MDPPKYNGTMHPEEWIQQFKASYYYNNTSGNEVFAGKTSLELNAIWNIFDNKNRSNVFYDDIYFVHQPTGRRLICTSYKSLSNYSEVSCYMNYGDYYEIWKLKQYNSTNNCAYVFAVHINLLCLIIQKLVVILNIIEETIIILGN
uniref:Uncharacterized protein n=1 Tax=Rhizophagus irregularis (strain DAOM 181602 / DAOM 197198 / MUCL 43194) TaxID=747089 RepID=U9SV75_RHIID